MTTRADRGSAPYVTRYTGSLLHPAPFVVLPHSTKLEPENLKHTATSFPRKNFDRGRPGHSELHPHKRLDSDSRGLPRCVSVQILCLEMSREDLERQAKAGSGIRCGTN